MVEPLPCTSEQTYLTFGTRTLEVLALSAAKWISLVLNRPLMKHGLTLYNTTGRVNHLWAPIYPSHKTDWITTDSLIALSCFLYTKAFSLQNVLKVEGRFLAFSRTLWQPVVYMHYHNCLSLFLWLLLVYLQCVRCIFYCVVCFVVLCTLPLVAFAFGVFVLSISLLLMAFVFVAFVYYS